MKHKKTIIKVFAIALSVFLSGCGNLQEQTDSVNSEQELSYDMVKEFGYLLFSQTAEESNPVLSPVSAYVALSMAGEGAGGTTREEFVHILGKEMTELSGNMMQTMPVKSKNTVVSLANSVWIDKQFTVNDLWINSVKQTMDTDIFEMDLSSDKTMNHVNKWVKKQTNGLITNILEKPLEKDNLMVLFDTIYFKSDWAEPFDKKDTCKDDFTLEGGDILQVEMMHKYNVSIEYIANEVMEGLILPYDNNHFALIALKPVEQDKTVRELTSLLTKEVISELLEDKKTELVNIKLPKFNITFDIILNEPLKNMGLTQAFDNASADFSLLGTASNGENLFISLVRQKARIVVDETKTEAAAATEVAFSGGGMIVEETVRNVFFDEPFLYMIMDMNRQLPLFIGIIDNPVF